jgi:hypothetical protein
VLGRGLQVRGLLGGEVIREGGEAGRGAADRGAPSLVTPVIWRPGRRRELAIIGANQYSGQNIIILQILIIII